MIAIQPKTRQLLGVNQQSYQALKASMSLNLRRQLLIAVCDDVRMQNRLATQLEADLAQALDPAFPILEGTLGPTDTDPSADLPGLQRLMFDPEEGNLPQQVAHWVRQIMLSQGLSAQDALPQLQVLGIEQMIHQPAITQNYFLRSLEKIEALLPRLNTSLLIWVPWPWLRTIQQSSPTFWNWRNGVFEFVSDPTPTAPRQESVHIEFPLFDDKSTSAHHSDTQKRLFPTPIPPLNSSGSSGSSGSSESSEGLYGENGENSGRENSGRDNSGRDNSGRENSGRDNSCENGENAAKVPPAAVLLKAQSAALELIKKQSSPTSTHPIANLVTSGGVVENPSLDVELHALLSEQPENQPAESQPAKNLENQPESQLESQPAKNLESQPTRQTAVPTQRIVASQNITALGGLKSVVSRVVNQEESTLPEPTDRLHDEASADALIEKEFAELHWGDFIDSSVHESVPVSAPGLDHEPESLDDTASAELLEGDSDALLEAPFKDQSNAQLEASLEDQFEDQEEHIKDQSNAEPEGEPDLELLAASVNSAGGNARSLQAPAETEAERRTQAAAHFALGLSYRNRIEAGERGLEVIEPAIAAYENGLSCLGEPHSDWVTGLNDLGTLYWLKAQQHQPDQAIVAMKRSIELYQEAITKSGVELPNGPSLVLQPGVIGQLYSNMGAVYTVLAACDDPLTYLQQAVKTYEKALPMVSLARSPGEYATLQNSLGSVYWKLSHYDAAAANLHRAIAAYNEALLGYKPDHKPLEYAAVQNNLGITYWSLAKHERSEFLLKHAIASYRDALNYRTSDVDPAGCAISYNNLALAYWDLSKQTHADIAQKSRYQKNSITAFEAALNISKLSGVLNTMDSAAIYHCLGDVHAQMIETAPSKVEVADSLQKSLYSYIQSLDGLSPDAVAYPGRFAAVIANLKLHYEKLGLEGQQSALNQIPPTLLPQVMLSL